MVDQNSAQIMEALKALGGYASLASEAPALDFIETPWEVFNHVVLGCGGIPRGKIIELYAKPSAGKSTLAYALGGMVQKAGGVVALIDAEHSYQNDYGTRCGLDNKTLIVPEFGVGEEALEQIKVLLALNIDLIIIDSVPAFQPAQVAGKAMKDMNMNDNFARAKMLSIFFNSIIGGYEVAPVPTTANKKPAKIKSTTTHIVDGKETNTIHKLRDKKTSMIWINHAKTKMGVMFGERTTTPGGESLKFYSSIRLGMTYMKKSKAKDFGQSDYKIVKVKAAKNKLAQPFGEALLRLHWDGAITLHDADIEVEYEEADHNETGDLVE